MIKKLTQSRRKSAALLIALLIVSVFSIFTVTIGRSIISSISRTTQISNSIIAQEAAYSGIEYGLIQWQNLTCDPACTPTVGGSLTCTLDAKTLNFSDDSFDSFTKVTDKSSNKIYADIGGVKVITLDSTCTTKSTAGSYIVSVGEYGGGLEYGGAWKGIKADINNGIILGDYIVVLPTPTTAIIRL